VSKRKASKNKISRRVGANLQGKTIREYRPGQHGQANRKLSDYGVQFIGKQKLKGYYGEMTEKQFHNIYHEAVRRRGDTVENLVGLLESRLDAFIFRCNFVPTIFAARQFVNHKHVMVNGKKVNIPSYRLRPGDLVEICEKAKAIKLVTDSIAAGLRPIPSYVELDSANMKAKYIKIPELAEIPYPVPMEPHLVIEFYSRA
jgi:small subunit ribosomal protein S4